MSKCEECDGTGEVEVERMRPMSFTNPCGDIYVTIETCEECYGSGEIEDEDLDEQTAIMQQLQV